MCDCAMVRTIKADPSRPVFHRTDAIGPFTVSTVLLPEGWYETRVFDDGDHTKHYGAPSALLEGYGSEAEALSGHRYWSGRNAAELRASFTEVRERMAR